MAAFGAKYIRYALIREETKKALSVYREGKILDLEGHGKGRADNKLCRREMYTDDAHA